MFTVFSGKFNLNTEKCNYYIYQEEECPETKKRHLQGYAEFKCQLRLSEAKKQFNDDSIHLEPRWGTQDQAIEYCSKKESRVGETIRWGMPKKQGNRSELDSLVDCIESGMTSKEILLEHRGIALKHINMIYKGLKAFHDCCALDRYIKANRENLSENLEVPSEVASHDAQEKDDKSSLSKNASEVEGNTKTSTEAPKDLDDEIFKKDKESIKKIDKVFRVKKLKKFKREDLE